MMKSASRDESLGIRMSQQELHTTSFATLRRSFLLSAARMAGLGLTGLCIPGRAEGGNDDDGGGQSVLPKPIAGGVSPLGIFIHHFPVIPTATPLQNLTEPSQITDFKGVVGLNRIRGAGVGLGFAAGLAFQADMGFMKGVFIGQDGARHRGAFAFI